MRYVILTVCNHEVGEIVSQFDEPAAVREGRAASVSSAGPGVCVVVRMPMRAGGVGVVCWGGVWSGVVWSGVVWSGVVWNGVVWSGVVWSGVVWSGVVWSGVVWGGVVWSGVWCGVECGVMWCGVVRSGVVWGCGRVQVHVGTGGGVLVDDARHVVQVTGAQRIPVEIRKVVRSRRVAGGVPVGQSLHEGMGTNRAHASGAVRCGAVWCGVA